jgi:hypothetical protein
MIHKKVLFCTLLVVHGSLFGMLTIPGNRQRSQSLPAVSAVSHKNVEEELKKAYRDNQRSLIELLRQQVSLKGERITELTDERTLLIKTVEALQCEQKKTIERLSGTIGKCEEALKQYKQLSQLPWLRFKKNLLLVSEIGTCVGMAMCLGYFGAHLHDSHCMQEEVNSPLFAYLCYYVR